MSTAAISILCALISAGAAIIVGVINSNAQHKRIVLELEKRDALQAYRIEQLEKKVDKHNNLVERMVVVEQSTKSAHHRIDTFDGGRGPRNEAQKASG